MRHVPVHQAEAALGLKRTKAGAGDKEHAYLVSRDNCERMLIVLFLVSAWAASDKQHAHNKTMRSISIRILTIHSCICTFSSQPRF